MYNLHGMPGRGHSQAVSHRFVSSAARLLKWLQDKC
ncbi:hypothetical protein OKW50_006380 [Paraburkholderia youngii]|uniref:Uncharacterized protein n=1 Tax=Paraburkholderia youngii TaxID=2782701 RepID=A0A7W8P8A3_9BURK|nr:hypothetical protein [Paraburkholderia youngii]